jgi:geranylgeranyl diphosphate synthase type I
MIEETTLALCDGQHRDLMGSHRKQLTTSSYLEMVSGKSAALLSASAAIGALLGGAGYRVVDGFAGYGRELGFAFQIRDDVLGLWGDDVATGKSVDDDLRAGKQTYPVVAARSKATAGVRRQLDAFLRAATTSGRAGRQARAELERLGARAASERAAHRHAVRAIDFLPKRGLSQPRRRELEELAHFAAERDS